MSRALEANWRSMLAVFGAAGLVVALCVAADYCLRTGLAWSCPVMALLRLPCPSCGTTRALAALSEWQFIAALRFNPLMILCIPGLPLALLCSDKLAAHAKIAWPVFILLVAANWVYLLLFLPR